LKNRWWILKIFNSCVNRALVVVITCCALHHYFETWKFFKLRCLYDAIRRDKLVGFRVDRLSTLKDGEHAKQIETLMRITLLNNG
jgi:hypothetical protein